MITLEPPFFQHEDVFVMRDHADPYTFYYLPHHPRIATVNGKPAFRFLKYAVDLDDYDPSSNKPTGGGFLFVDVDLGFDDDVLDDVRRELQAAFSLDREPNLVPPQWESGTVQFMVLGRASELPPEGGASPPEPAEPQDDRWVTSFTASGVPSLYGRNRAIFQAGLSKEAASLVDLSFDAEAILPIGVVYNLKFLALRPAYKVKIEADWKRVYEHFSEQWSLDYIVVDGDIYEAVDKLVDEGLLTIHFDVTDPAAEAEAKEALRELKQIVLEKFFEPRMKPDEGTEARPMGVVGDFVFGLRHAISPGGGYSRRDLKTEEIHVFDVEMSMARAVERGIAPQAHLSLLVGESGIRKEDVITEVNLDDPFFQEFNLELLTTGGWDDQGIQLITASVAYGDKRGDYAFDSEGARFTFLTNYRPELGYDYAYEWRVIFKHDAPEGMPEFILPPRPKRGGPLVLNPAELFRLRRVKVIALKTLSFEDFPTVEVDVRYVWPNGSTTTETALLGAEHGSEEEVLKLRLDRSWPMDVDYRITYHRVGLPPLVLPWVPTTESTIVVGDPRGVAMAVRVMVGARPGELTNLSVDLRYTQPDGTIATGHAHFGSGDMTDQRMWTIHLDDPTARTYEYQQTIVTAEGEVITTPWRRSDRPTLVVGLMTARMMPISVAFDPSAPSFDEQRLQHIEMVLRYEDPTNNLSLKSEHTFKSELETHNWSVRRADLARDEYSYELVYRYGNGVRKRVGPVATRVEQLVLSTDP